MTEHYEPNGNGADRPSGLPSECATARTSDVDDEPDAEIARLARLSSSHYEKERRAAAKRLDFRITALDRMVRATRGGPTGNGRALQGHPIELSEPRPWENPVDGATLLNEIVSGIRRYVVLPEHAARACACWVLHTHLAEHFLVSPRLGISSPTKGCGKTTLLDVVSRLVLRPLMSSNVTPAAVFRVIEKYKPCLLIDEADTFLGVNDELRGILNSGHRKGGSVLRVTGDDLEPRRFSTFGPCAIALIGTLPSTLADRSIPVELSRRRPSEPVESYRPDRAGHLDRLARQTARWAQDNAIAVGAADPEMPEVITNRTCDNWRVLKAISSVAGGHWPGYIDEAAMAAQAQAGEEASRLELLLGDIRNAGFIGDETEIRSADLVQRLIDLEGRPWAELGRGHKPLTQNGLARLLKPLGIGPGNVGPENSRARGYKREQFQDAFERYLTPNGDPEVHRCTERDEIRVSRISEPHSADDGCALGECKKPNNDRLLGTCALSNGGNGQSMQRPKPGEPRSPEWRGLGLEPHTIEELARRYLDRFEAERKTPDGDADPEAQGRVDAELRKAIAGHGVFDEFVELEFERVMAAVFAPLEAGR
jgi:putative DNA primase/helicase